MARKVISKECEESINRVLAAVDSMPEEFESLRPELVRSLLNDGGTKNFNTLSVIASAYNNSLLGSTGMLMANIASAMAQGILYVPNSMIRNGVVNTYAAFAALAGRDSQMFANMGRYFASAMKTGIASDIGQDIQYVARTQGISEPELRKRAKEAYVRSWAATDDSITEADIDVFVNSINLSDEEVVRFITDIEYMANQKVPESLRWLTIPQRAAVAIDESSKVFFRMLKISELARKQALKDAAAKGVSVDELHNQYFNEVMDVHNAKYQGELELAETQTKAAKFRAVRAANQALEKKNNAFFQDLFSDEDIPYEDIREFALNMTFQRRLGDKPGTFNIPGMINMINREKAKIGPEYSLGNNLKALALNLQFPFAKTPYNIVMEGVSYTPLALIPFMRPKVLKKKIKEGKVELAKEDMDDYLVRVALGTPVLFGIGTLFAESNAEGLPFIVGSPIDAQERRRWQQAGIPERSILVGDVYVPFERIEPVGTVLSLYVDLWEAVMKERDTDDPDYSAINTAIDETATALLNATLNKTILEGMVKFLDYFKYDKGKGLQDYGADLVKGFIPTGVSDLARIIDDEERIAREPYERIMQRIPGVREMLPVDTMQLEGVDQGQNAFEIITKMNFVPTNQTEVQKYIYRTEANIPVINKEFLGVTLNSAELSLLRELSRPYQDGILGGLVAGERFKSARASLQKRMLEYHSSRAVNPSTNKALMREFIQEGTKRFGPNWVKTLQARKFNETLQRKGLQDYQDYMSVELD